MKYYYRLRLWFWWKYSIKKDTQSKKLSEIHIWALGYYDDEVAITRVVIAQLLDTGVNIRDIDIKYIKRARI